MSKLARVQKQQNIRSTTRDREEKNKDRKGKTVSNKEKV